MRASAMADAMAGLSGRLAVGLLGPRPSVKIISFKLGALEIVLRGVALVRKNVNNYDIVIIIV